MTDNFDHRILIRLRADRLWTQEELSLASGVSVRTIQRIERGEGISAESWKALAAAFDVPASDLSIITRDRVQMTPRQEAIRLTIGCLGGLIGCSVGWWAVLKAFEASQGGLTLYLLTLMMFVATTVLVLVPSHYWLKALR